MFSFKYTYNQITARCRAACCICRAWGRDYKITSRAAPLSGAALLVIFTSFVAVDGRLAAAAVNRGRSVEYSVLVAIGAYNRPLCEVIGKDTASNFSLIKNKPNFTISELVPGRLAAAKFQWLVVENDFFALIAVYRCRKVT